jgi:hypothetical protein
MRKEVILKKIVAGIGSAALAIALSACAHHDVAKDQGYGQIRTEAPATSANGGTSVGTTVAPNNTAGIGATSTPSALSGPAALDNSGRAYTSSSAGGNGNASVIGNNTNVNLIPKRSKSEAVVTESPAPVETMVVTNSPTPVIVETPAPAPLIVETPVETPAPMASSTTETTTPEPKHHRRMHKD